VCVFGWGGGVVWLVRGLGIMEEVFVVCWGFVLGGGLRCSLVVLVLEFVYLEG